MKIWEYVKIIRFKKIFKKELIVESMVHNDLEVEKMDLFIYASHHDNYKVLRKIKIPTYNKGFVFRKKKGFNTLFFQQNFDIVITDKNGLVLDTFINCPTGFISKHYEKGFNVFFFVVGTINNLRIKKKDTLTIRHKWVDLLREI